MMKSRSNIAKATYLPFILTAFLRTAKSQEHASTSILVNYPEASLGGYLPTIFINWILKTVKNHGHTSTGILVNYLETFLGGYLPTFYINWIFKTFKTADTQPQAFR